jgi:transposase
MPHPAQQIAFQEYIHAVKESTERVDRLTEQIQKLMPEWRLAPVVKALQAMRGVAPMIATITMSEIGDLSRLKIRVAKKKNVVESPRPAIAMSGAL